MSHAPRTHSRCIVLLLFMLSLVGPALAAEVTTGIVVGRVINTTTGGPIPGAKVNLRGSAQSATTDLSGEFRLSRVPSGQHALEVVRTGFQTLNLTDVTVTDGETAKLECPLTPASENLVRMDAFSVSAEAVASSDVGLLSARQKSAAVSDAIGSEQFSRLAVSNAAEALGKIAGGSLVDGKYVLIRGLGDRYSNTLLNGAAVPTADPEKRAVQMDLFPSELIESIVTTKSFTPDQPGAFSGGSVNMKTKSFPEHFFFSLSAGLEVNSETTGKETLRAKGLTSAPTLPANLPNRTAAELAARGGSFELARTLDQATKAFGSDPIYPTARKSAPNFDVSAAVGDRLSFGETGMFGYTATFTYEHESAQHSDGATNRFIGTAEAVQPKLLLTDDRSLLSFDPSDATAMTPAFGVTASTETEVMGVFGKLAVRPTLEHELSLDLFHNQTIDDTVRRGVGEETNNYAGNIFEVYDLLRTERSVSSAQLAGKSLFPALRDLQVDWRASYSKSTQDQPDYRTLSGIYDLRGVFANATGVQPNRFFRELEENAVEGALDLTYPFQALGGRQHRIRTGMVASHSERTYSEQRFQYQGNPSSLAQLQTYPSPIGVVNETANSVSFGRTITRLQEPNNYKGEQEIGAGYAMADMQLTDRWRAIFGIRYEQTKMETTPVRVVGFNPRDGLIDQDEALPAMSLVFASSPRVNWRFAYGRTLARPTFKELTDIRYEDVFTGDVYLGNPGLELTVIDNLDARWEWFPRRDETLAVSAFYKKLNRPIEVLFEPGVGSIQPQNVDEGRVYGVELEFRRRLNFINEALANWSVGANYALIHSEVTIPTAELALLRTFDRNAKAKRELLGQSPYTFNFDLTYARASSGTTATLSFNAVGERLDLVNHGPLPDVFEQPAPLLNLVVSQRLSDRWRLKFAAKNLLDPLHEKTISGTSGDYVWSRYRRGQAFSVSVNYFFE